MGSRVLGSKVQGSTRVLGEGSKERELGSSKARELGSKVLVLGSSKELVLGSKLVGSTLAGNKLCDRSGDQTTRLRHPSLRS